MDIPVKKYSINGLSCANCALRIENALKNENYDNVHINFSTKSLLISSNDVFEINQIISKIEPGASIRSIKKNKQNDGILFQIRPIFTIIISFLLLLTGILVVQDEILSIILLLIAYITSGWKVLYKAFKQLINRDFTNEYLLMSIATIGAILINEIPEAVAVMVFYTIGEYLQNRAVDHSRQSISSLLDIRPDEVHLIKSDTEIRTPIENVVIDDIILVKPGERVPLDGIVLQGNSTLDMSTLTGESRPISVKENEAVYSGSITSNALKIKVTSSHHESTVSRILDAVETASTKKSTKELFITRFARYYTPSIILITLLIAVLPPLVLSEPFEIWLYRALVILVISCPCALVVSVPLVYFSGIGNSSRRGILLKGANVLDKLNNITAVLWDKTGTLTKGNFKVVFIVPGKNYTNKEVLSVAALAESHSTHPIAKSIRNAFKEEIDTSIIVEYEELPALGIKAITKSGDTLVVGNDKMIHYIDCPHPECIKDQTAVYVVKNNEYIGYIIIDDEIKESSLEAIAKLRDLNIPKIAILTGDTKNIAERVGKKLDIDNSNIYSSLMPLNKLEILEYFINQKNDDSNIVFVGDGINDSPVIARADIGVAMGSIGSDATIEAADMVIMDDNPLQLVNAIKIAKRTDRIAKENITFAIGIKAIFILLGTMGLATMWGAVFADIGVTILTVINSLRLLR